MMMPFDRAPNEHFSPLSGRPQTDAKPNLYLVDGGVGSEQKKCFKERVRGSDVLVLEKQQPDLRLATRFRKFSSVLVRTAQVDDIYASSDYVPWVTPGWGGETVVKAGMELADGMLVRVEHPRHARPKDTVNAHGQEQRVVRTHGLILVPDAPDVEEQIASWARSSSGGIRPLAGREDDLMQVGERLKDQSAESMLRNLGLMILRTLEERPFEETGPGSFH